MILLLVSQVQFDKKLREKTSSCIVNYWKSNYMYMVKYEKYD